MFIGVNTNIKHKGEIFHIQTEDGGLDQHTLTTILFKNGAILSSKKTSYLDLPKSPDYKDTVRQMMQEQHKQMIRDLVGGKFETGTGSVKNEGDLEKEVDGTNEVLKTASIASVAEEKRTPLASKQNPARINGLDGLIFNYLAKKKTARS